MAKERGGEGKPRPLAPWRLHDFRRTAVTWMAGNGVAAIYQRGEFLAGRKAALEAWAEWVTPSGSSDAVTAN
jgi:hypothetical protein